MTWPKKGATHYHAQLGLRRLRLCNQMVGCQMGADTLGEWARYIAILKEYAQRWRGENLYPKRHHAPRANICE